MLCAWLRLAALLSEHAPARVDELGLLGKQAAVLASECEPEDGCEDRRKGDSAREEQHEIAVPARRRARDRFDRHGHTEGPRIDESECATGADLEPGAAGGGREAELREVLAAGKHRQVDAAGPALARVEGVHER